MADTKKPSQHIQDCFVFLCITDVEFVKMARQNIPSKYMEAVVTQDILQLCYDYYGVYNEAPEGHAHDEVSAMCIKKDEDSRRRYMKYLHRICMMDQPNKAYVLTQIDNFVSERMVNEAMIEAIKIMAKTGSKDAITYLFSKLTRTAEYGDLGLIYAETDTPEYYTAKTGEAVIPLGMPHIDYRLGPLRAGQLLCFFAGYKTGKTWGCGHICKQGLMHGKKILYISHEATQDELEMRMDMAIGGLTSDRTGKDGAEEEVMCWAYEDKPKDVRFEDHRCSPVRQESMNIGSVFSPERVAKARQTIRRYGGDLRIRKFAMATGSVADIERLLDSYELLHGWVPDIVINDYVEKMKLPLGESAAQRDRINEAYIQLKRVADERQVLMVTASQIKTGSLATLEVDESKIPAEDARKLGNIDIGILFQQTQKCIDQGWFLAWVLVSRSSDQKFGCKVSKNLKIGQFALETWPFVPSEDGGGGDEEVRQITPGH